MTVRALLAFLPPTLIGALLLWQALGAVPSPPEITPRERQVPVSYVTATPREFVPRVSGYGTVAPARVWTAVAHVGGPVVDLHPDFVRGGFVAEGEVLIRIAADDYVIALERAAADLAAAEARLDEMRASEGTTIALLAIEREALALVEADLARTERLARTGTVSATVVDQRRLDVLAHRSKVQTQENALALLPAQIAALDATAVASRTAKAAAALDVARTVIRAPFDARVARIDVEIGQFVGAGTVMGALDGAAAAEIDVQVPQNRMAALVRLAAAAPTRDDDTRADSAAPAARRGVRRASSTNRGSASLEDPRRLSARVHLGLGATVARWNGEVVRLSETVSAETRSVGVIVRVEAPYDGGAVEQKPPLVKGMFVRVDLEAPPVTGVILLPRAAIRNGRVMLVGADDRLAYVRVAPVFVADDIAVLAPEALPAGARVITSSLSPAIEGLLLAPEPDLSAEAHLAAAAATGDDL